MKQRHDLVGGHPGERTPDRGTGVAKALFRDVVARADRDEEHTLHAGLQVEHHRGAGFFLQVASRDDCGQAAAVCLIKRPGFCAQWLADHNRNDRATGLQPVE